MTMRLLTTIALSTFGLAACTIHSWQGAGPEPGNEGAPCATADDCDPGLLCEDLVRADPAADNEDTTCEGGHDGVGGQGGDGPGVGGGDSGGGGAEPACIDDADCAEGEICDIDGLCAIPTCDAIDDESACLARADCETVYAGVDCSCGQGCECQPGEPGCVCQSFEFFHCKAL